MKLQFWHITSGQCSAARRTGGNSGSSATMVEHSAECCKSRLPTTAVGSIDGPPITCQQCRRSRAGAGAGKDAWIASFLRGRNGGDLNINKSLMDNWMMSQMQNVFILQEIAAFGTSYIISDNFLQF